MNFLRAEDKLYLHFSNAEFDAFQDVLKLFPRVPPGHQRLTKSGCVPDAEAAQTLLDEALAGQRKENKDRLAALLSDPQRLTKTETACTLCLAVSEAEWLLQVLNDICVGSWILLGSPEDELKPKELNETTVPNYWAMEMAGYFQAHVLEALE